MVFTARAKRLYGTSIVLIIIIALIAYFTTDIGYTIICLTGATVLSFGILLVSNILLIPCEKSVNRWYYNDAKRILNSMPDLTIIGITGSYGKTSTKHFLHTILSEKYNVLMTPGSYNTTLGVIRTIREQLKSYHNIFIVEMGAKQTGDIKEICDLVNPSIGIITAIGEQHLETFKTITNIQKTKFELIDALPRNGLAVLVEQYNRHVAAGFADRNGFIVAVVAGEMECGTVHGGLGRSVHIDNLKTRNRGIPRVHIARLQRFTAESGFAQRGRRALAQCTPELATKWNALVAQLMAVTPTRSISLSSSIGKVNSFFEKIWQVAPSERVWYRSLHERSK